MLVDTFSVTELNTPEVTTYPETKFIVIAQRFSNLCFFYVKDLYT